VQNTYKVAALSC